MLKRHRFRPFRTLKRVLIGVSILSLGVVYDPKITHADTQSVQTSVNLDVARNYYSMQNIKNMIDLIQQNHGHQLQLHLTDNQNYGVQSDYLNQKPNQSTKNIDQMVINPKTKRPYLTYEQLNDLIKYAQGKDITIVPEIDIPAHSKALISLLKSKISKTTYRKILTSTNELKYQNQTAQKIMLEIVNDFSKHIPANTTVSISGDEMTVSDKSDELKFIELVKKANNLVNDHQQTLQIYNDGIGKYNLDDLPKNVQVVYWSLSGDTNSITDAAYNMRSRSTPEAIIKHGNPVINANSNYLYLNNQVDGSDSQDVDLYNHQLQNMTLNTWNSNPAKSLSVNHTILSIWGNENKFSIIDTNTTLNRLKPYINAYFYQMQNK